MSRGSRPSPLFARLVAVVAAGCASAAVAEPPLADIVLRSGRIYLVEPEGRWADAIAVRDGKIAAVGNDDDVRKLIGPTTQVIDLKGRMAMRASTTIISTWLPLQLT